MLLKLPIGKEICGVTSLDNLLYVLLGSVSSEQIEVYDTALYSLQRHLTVPGRLSFDDDIVACPHNHCAYVSCGSNKSMNKLSLPDATVKNWPINDAPSGLSVTYTHNVLVTCCKVCKIKEFSTDGKLLRQLPIPPEVTSPWHTIQLSGGQFVVFHFHESYSREIRSRVCLVGADGKIMQSSGTLGCRPRHLAVHRNGFVYVAGDGVVSILSRSNGSMTYKGKFLSGIPPFHFPSRLHLSVNQRCMYVVVNANQSKLNLLRYQRNSVVWVVGV